MGVILDRGTNASSVSQTDALWMRAYRRYFRFWLRLAKTVNLPEDDAKDIINGIVASLLADPGKKFESIEHVRNYVAKSVLNRAIRSKQRGERKTAWSENSEYQHPVLPEECKYDDELLMATLRDALEHLSRKDFDIIKLRFYSGLTFNEVSQLLHSPISTLKSREDAAIRKIRKLLQKKGF